MTAFVWNAKRVTRALGLPEAAWEHSYRSLVTDTRTLGEGDLFVALKGEKFDAHDFLADARLANVGGVVVRTGTPRWPGFDWFEVPDTLVALGQLARYRRDQLKGPVVAITGTNGKTSTRELTAAALSGTFQVHRSQANLNNLVGVPLTILAAPEETGALVVECGASLVGEIGRMREIVRPDVAVVTNVGSGHLEGFGSAGAVLEEKTSLLKDVATAVVGISPGLPDAARKLAKNVITADIEGPADWTAESVRLTEDGRPVFTARGVNVELPLHGRHMVCNALIAMAVADVLGIPPAAAAENLKGTTIPGGRSEISTIGGITVINDCYNANPQSMRAALDLMTALRGRRRAVVVAGTMRELGPDAPRLHREAAESILAAGPDVVAAIGDFVPAFASLGDKASHTILISGPTPADVAPALRDALHDGDVMLLKASRGVKLETIIPLLWPDQTPAEAH